jgi:hypothetical protein
MALRLAPADEIVEVMRRLVADPNSRVRLIAAGSLLFTEASDTVAGAVLMEAMGDPALRVREAARELLESLGAGGAAFVASLKGRTGEAGEPGIAGSYGPLRPTPEGPGDAGGRIVPNAGRSPARGEMG